MSLINLYSLSHLIIWFLAGRFTRINWIVFLVLSIGWEFLELVIPFEFAEEWIGNKLADMVINILGFYVGTRLKGQTQKQDE